MDSKARIGRGILITIIAVIAVTELVLVGYSVQIGRVRPGQIGRVLVTAWLLWQVWDGAGWARWLIAGLCFAAAATAVILGFGADAEDKPQLALIMKASAALLLLLGLGLASPWVGAYQSARRADSSRNSL